MIGTGQVTYMNEKVLVIEDDSETLTCLLELLESYGFKGIGAKNGLMGLLLAKQQVPDAIISDINMPKLNGYGVLNALRQDPKTAMIPFIFLTGDPVNFDLLKELEVLPDGYLTKPIIPEKLIRAIALQVRKNCDSS
ncbi:response regulator [Microseira wollei]|uniref:Two component AraC family transcriptional regulator n=1 Tax=Microseira wollei NIES-4236 TaxID=2530354 RepID=A0AAV3XQ86_9CYAN|nr:response regulator [Microseira wollei]GET44553.1 two component AraC family transcriptional regulator [Microseira wollei NIES-4236]